MPQIVRYGRAARRYAPYVAKRYAGRYTTAFRAANAAYRFSKSRTAKRAASKIGKLWRAKKKARMSIGQRIGLSTTKLHTVSAVTIPTLLNTRTLNTSELTDIPQKTGTQADNRSVRERQVANVRGFKICLSAYSDATVPVYWNVAVISKKNGDTKVIALNDFFRGYDEARSESFSSSNLSGLDYHCRPINTDQYIVLKHKRMVINPLAGNGLEGSAPNFKTLDMWVPLKRQLRYEAEQDTDANQKVWLVMWCSRFTAPAAAPIETGIRYQRRTIAYFRDPK